MAGDDNNSDEPSSRPLPPPPAGDSKIQPERTSAYDAQSTISTDEAFKEGWNTDGSYLLPKLRSYGSNDVHPSGDLHDPLAQKRDARFWMVLLALCASLFASALELSVVSTALPTIVNDLHSTDFIWVGTAYSLASTAFLPMCGGLSEVIGRKRAMLLVLVIFAAGSALCGAAPNMTVLIAGRTIQGIGGGGIQSITSIILGDLVPLKDRGTYNSLFALTWGIASGAGPLIGGLLAQKGNWRWIFWMNLPICAVSITLVAISLRLPTPPGTFREKLHRMDFRGNVILIASTTAIVLGMTWGGVTYPWTSIQVLLPLILGGVGMVLFLLYDAFLAPEPIVPFRILSNRTSLSGYLQTFLSALLVISLAYYVPIYFQGCKGATPIQSGLYFLAFTATIPVFSIIAGLSVKKLQMYRPQIIVSWVIAAAAAGAFCTINATTPLSRVLGFEIFLAAGAGPLYSMATFPILAPLAVEDNARALSFFSFMRSFATIWGITLGSVALQNELPKKLPAIIVKYLPPGVDPALSIIPELKGLYPVLRSEVQKAFASSLASIWFITLGACGVGLVVSLAMKGLALHGETDARWTLLQDQEQQELGKRRGSPVFDA